MAGLERQRQLCVLVEVNGTQLNRHLKPFLDFVGERGTGVRIVALHGEMEGQRAAQVVQHALAKGDSAVLSAAAWPDTVDAFFPAPQGDMACIRRALAQGIKTFQNAVGPYSPADLLDYYQGYVCNPATQWYAKLFPEPVYVAHPHMLDIGLGVTINPRAIILNSGPDETGSLVKVGRATHIGADVLLNLGPAEFTVGSFTMISANFAAHPARHSLSHISNFSITKGPFAFFGALYDKASPVTVGNDVWIAEGVKCLPGVHVANGAVIGAGSIVTRSVEPYAIYAGNPARFIRYRFDKKKIDFLNDSGWWNREFDYLKQIREHFRKDITDLPVEELRALLA